MRLCSLPKYNNSKYPIYRHEAILIREKCKKQDDSAIVNLVIKKNLKYMRTDVSSNNKRSA
jgi:hypothetical protein